MAGHDTFDMHSYLIEFGCLGYSKPCHSLEVADLLHSGDWISCMLVVALSAAWSNLWFVKLCASIIFMNFTRMGLKNGSRFFGMMCNSDLL